MYTDLNYLFDELDKLDPKTVLTVKVFTDIVNGIFDLKKEIERQEIQNKFNY